VSIDFLRLENIVPGAPDHPRIGNLLPPVEPACHCHAGRGRARRRATKPGTLGERFHAGPSKPQVEFLLEPRGTFYRIVPGRSTGGVTSPRLRRRSAASARSTSGTPKQSQFSNARSADLSKSSSASFRRHPARELHTTAALDEDAVARRGR
jgi:hypothetical protein